MDDKLDALMKMLRDSESRMSQEMQAIKAAVDDIKPEMSALQSSVASLKPEMEEIKANFDAWKPEMEAKVTTSAAPTTAVTVCHRDTTAVATPSSSSGIPDADLIVAISGVASMPSTCSTDGLHQDTHEDSIVAVSLLFETTPPWQSSSVLEFDIMAPTRSLTKIPEEVTFKWTPVTMPCSVLGRSPAINARDNVSLYSESPPPPRLARMLSDGFHTTLERAGLLLVPSCPPDAPDCTRDWFSFWQQFLPAPIPKPPWLLLVHEMVTVHGRPALVFAGALHEFEEEPATIGMIRNFHMRAVSADVQGWVFFMGNIWEWSHLIASVRKIALVHIRGIIFDGQGYTSLLVLYHQVESASDTEMLGKFLMSWSNLHWEPGILQLTMGQQLGCDNVLMWFATEVVTEDPYSECKCSDVDILRHWLYRIAYSTAHQWDYYEKDERKVLPLWQSNDNGVRLHCPWNPGILISTLNTSHAEMKPEQYGILLVPLPGTACSPFLDVILVIQAGEEVHLLDGLPHRCYISKGAMKIHMQAIPPKFNVVIKLLVWLNNDDRNLGTLISTMYAAGEGELVTSNDSFVHCLCTWVLDMNQRCKHLGAHGQCIVYIHPDSHLSTLKLVLRGLMRPSENTRCAQECELVATTVADIMMSRIVCSTGGVNYLIHDKGFARYLCSPSALTSMKILFEVGFTCVLPRCIDIRMDRSRGSGELFQCMASYLLGDCFSNNTYGLDISSIIKHSQISKAGLPVATTIFFWVPVAMDGEANKRGRSLWDPGGCLLVVCSCENWQAHSQGGRNVTNQAAFSDQVHVGRDYYIAFVNKISINYDYYLDQVYYFKTVRSDLIYYHEDYHGDADKIKEVHVPWDPGKSALRYSPKTSAWGQAEFQGGRKCYDPRLRAPSWAVVTGYQGWGRPN